MGEDRRTARHVADARTPEVRVPDDAPDALGDPEVDEIEADITDGADPTTTARRGVGMAPETGNDQDPASYVNT